MLAPSGISSGGSVQTTLPSVISSAVRPVSALYTITHGSCAAPPIKASVSTSSVMSWVVSSWVHSISPSIVPQVMHRYSPSPL